MATMILKSVSGEKQVELRGQIVAGRSEDADLVLTLGHPSRRHARITAGDDGVWIEDLGSTNGTYVNGRKVDASVQLNAGDRVRFDMEEFEVVGAAGAAPEPDPNATVLRAPPPPPPAAEPAAPAPQHDAAPASPELPARRGSRRRRRSRPSRLPPRRNAPPPTRRRRSLPSPRRRARAAPRGVREHGPIRIRPSKAAPSC